MSRTKKGEKRRVYPKKGRKISTKIGFFNGGQGRKTGYSRKEGLGLEDLVHTIGLLGGYWRNHLKVP